MSNRENRGIVCIVMFRLFLCNLEVSALQAVSENIMYLNIQSAVRQASYRFTLSELYFKFWHLPACLSLRYFSQYELFRRWFFIKYCLIHSKIMTFILTKFLSMDKKVLPNVSQSIKRKSTETKGFGVSKRRISRFLKILQL